jgi:hypothetical protein
MLVWEHPLEPPSAVKRTHSQTPQKLNKEIPNDLKKKEFQKKKVNAKKREEQMNTREF